MNIFARKEITNLNDMRQLQRRTSPSRRLGARDVLDVMARLSKPILSLPSQESPNWSPAAEDFIALMRNGAIFVAIGMLLFWIVVNL